MHGMQKCAKLLIINQIKMLAMDWLNTIKMCNIGLSMIFWPTFLANLGPRVLHISIPSFITMGNGELVLDGKREISPSWSPSSICVFMVL